MCRAIFTNRRVVESRPAGLESDKASNLERFSHKSTANAISSEGSLNNQVN